MFVVATGTRGFKFFWCLCFSFLWLWSLSVFIQKESVPCNSFSHNPLFLYWSFIVDGCVERGVFHNLVMKSPSFTGSVFWGCDRHKCLCSSSSGTAPSLILPPAPFHGYAVPICLLEALSPVDYVFSHLDKTGAGGAGVGRNAVPSAGIMLWQSLSPWRVGSCYREGSEFISLSLLFSSPCQSHEEILLNMRTWWGSWRETS